MQCPLSAGKVADKFNVNINTIYKWRRRKEEDLLQILKPFIPKVTRKTIYTTLKQEGLNKNSYILPKDESKKSVKKFKDYKEGYIHIDVKYLPKVDGKRKYLFASIDRKTRLVLISIYDKKDKKSSNDFLKKVINFYPFKINKILTDNGKEFTDRFTKNRNKPSGNHLFDKTCKTNKIEHRLTMPYTPQTNGMIERFNRRIQENVLDIYKFNSQKKLEESLNKYVHNYNFHIKQKKLEYNSPIAFIEKSLPKIYSNFIEQYNQRGSYN